MVFKYPGPHQLQDGGYDYITVEEAEVEAHVALGWSRTPAEAKAKATAVPQDPEEEADDDSPPTREELEEQCRKLGIKVDGRYSDARLAKLIADKLG